MANKCNFSVEEIELLNNLVDKYRDIIECKVTNVVYNRKKEDAWQNLLTDFNSISTIKRNVQQLKTKYKNMKRIAQKNLSNDKVNIFATGGGTATMLSTSLDERLCASLVRPIACQYDCDFDYENAVNRSQNIARTIPEVEGEERTNEDGLVEEMAEAGDQQQQEGVEIVPDISTPLTATSMSRVPLEEEEAECISVSI